MLDAYQVLTSIDLDGVYCWDETSKYLVVDWYRRPPATDRLVCAFVTDGCNICVVFEDVSTSIDETDPEDTGFYCTQLTMTCPDSHIPEERFQLFCALLEYDDSLCDRGT
jgi:hypothetical protein